MPDAPPRTAADQFEAAIDAILADFRALLDKARAAFPLSAADLPDIREGLGYAARMLDDLAGCGVPEAAAKAARYREIRHRIEVAP